MIKGCQKIFTFKLHALWYPASSHSDPDLSIFQKVQLKLPDKNFSYSQMFIPGLLRFGYFNT